MHTRLGAQLTDYSKSIEQSANQSLALLNQLERFSTTKLLASGSPADSFDDISTKDRVKQNTQRFLTGITELSGITENIGITFENQQPLLYPPVYSKQDIRLNRFVTAALQLNDELSATPTQIQTLPSSSLIEGGMTVLAQKSLYQQDKRLAILFLEININKLIESSGLNTTYNDLSFEITDQTGRRIYANHLDPLVYTDSHQFTIANNTWQIKATCTISDNEIQRGIDVLIIKKSKIEFINVTILFYFFNSSKNDSLSSKAVPITTIFAPELYAFSNCCLLFIPPPTINGISISFFTFEIISEFIGFVAPLPASK